MGKVRAVAARKLEVRWDAECAEVAAACIYGLETVYRLGLSRVLLECDAKNAISTIKKEVVGYPPLFLLYKDIRKLMDHFELFDCLHVKRMPTLLLIVARWHVSVGRDFLCTNYIPQCFNKSF